MSDFWKLFENPTVVVGVLALLGVIGGGLFSWLSSTEVAKETSAAKNLETQLDGWKTFANELQEERKELRARIGELETRLIACEDDRRKLWAEVTELKYPKRES